LRTQASVGNWLYGVAYRTALKARAARVRRRAREAGAPSRPPADPLAEMTVAEAQTIVDEELARLPEKFRAPLVLCCLEGLARDEAARQLGCSDALVKSRLEQARQRLRSRLSRRGLAFGAGMVSIGMLGNAAQAAVPAPLAGATMQAVSVMAAGAAAPAQVSVRVAALVEEMMHRFLIAKVKLVTAGVLALVVLGIGICSWLPALQADSTRDVRPASQPSSRADSSNPVPRARRASKPAVVAQPEALQRWSNAEVVFLARLTNVQQGPVARSIPPIYTHGLEFKVKKVLRGALKKGEELKVSHSARQENPPQFPLGKDCVVGMSKVRGMWQVQAVEEATAKELVQAELACKVPAGWSLKEGRLVSPWASLGKDAWPAAARGKGWFTCSVTGRPSLLAGEAVQFLVEPVPPKVKLKYGNPDGDGEYRITVKNSTQKPITVPALLSDGRKVLWNESLVVICQGKVYSIPGAEKVRSAPKPTVLEPGQALSTVVNVFGLKGPEWPRGGYRIEFRFALGEKNVTHSFYYLSRHHDPLRQKLSGGDKEKK
jgi:hypothetical protein